MRALFLFCALSLVLSGCGQDELRARYRAEKARYWAERQALRFSLQSDPQMRRRYYESGLAFLEVAQKADPGAQPMELTPGVLSELQELEAWGRMEAGSAFLRAGYFELADPELAKVQAQGPVSYRREAALLRAEAARVRRNWSTALIRYREFHAILREAPEDFQWTEELLELPLDFLAEMKAGGDPELLDQARVEGKEFYDWVRKTWPESPMAERAAFLDHRLDLIAERWDEARAGIEEYLARDLPATDRWNARFDLAEILGPGLGRVEEAAGIYREVGENANDEGLRGLARLRRGELLLSAGRVEEGMRILGALEEDYREDAEIASAATLSRAIQLESMNEWSQAQRLYRRIIMRYPDTPAGIAAPLRTVELHKRREDERAWRGALLVAETQYRRLVAGHSLDGQIGLRARRSLIQCLLWDDKPEDALAELEQLHHILGRSPGGADALLQAARVAADQLEDEGLARRYLEWIAQELPLTPAAAEARELLAAMTPPKTGGSGIDSPDAHP